MVPIPGSATLMGDCGDEDVAGANAIKKRERIARKNVAVFASPTNWPSLGRFTNGCDCVLEFEQEALSCNLASLSIPRFVFEKFLLSFEMKTNRFHPRR